MQPLATAQAAATRPPPGPYVSLEEEVTPSYDDESGSSAQLNLRGQLPYLVNGQQYIVRVKIPFVTGSPAQAVTGPGDSTLTYLAEKDSGSARWTFGATARIPTAGNDSLGSGKYSIGPAGGYEWASGNWIVGVSTTNYFSVIGPSWRAPVAQTKIDPGATLVLPRGWAIGTSSMSFTYNWYQSTWVQLPIGVRVEKALGQGTFHPFAGLFSPLVASLEVEKNLAAVADSPEWTIRAMFRWNLPRRKE